MNRLSISLILIFVSTVLFAQTANETFSVSKSNGATTVKNQCNTGTCWSFATTSLVESQCLKKGMKDPNLSEMFTVRNIYIEKAKNYLLRQGHTQFGEGGLGHDVIRAYGIYGAMPEDVYSGLINGEKMYDHQKMVAQLQQYLDSILKIIPLPDGWLEGYTKILDDNMGVPPAKFTYNGKEYTPISFAKDVMKFNKEDYISITSFTDHPYFSSYVLQVPDNFSNESFYNLPLDQMLTVIKTAVNKGYTVSWDADVSNYGFLAGKGLALLLDRKVVKDSVNADIKEDAWDVKKRQALYENLTTQDDHLMHIVGVEKSKSGKTFFIVKNSWGEVGPYKGYLNASESYVAINTISIVVPKAAIAPEILAKLKIK